MYNKKLVLLCFILYKKIASYINIITYNMLYNIECKYYH